MKKQVDLQHDQTRLLLLTTSLPGTSNVNREKRKLVRYKREKITNGRKANKAMK